MQQDNKFKMTLPEQLTANASLRSQWRTNNKPFVEPATASRQESSTCHKHYAVIVKFFEEYQED